MSKETVTKRCSLCFDKVNEDELINRDSLQLCPDCYKKYDESAYNQRTMLLKSVKCYRRLVIQYEESSNVKFDTKFNI